LGIVPLDQALHDLLGFDQETLLVRLERRDRETRVTARTE